MFYIPTLYNYEKYAAIPPELTRLPAVRGDITLACILKPTTLKDLEGECRLMTLDASNWEELLRTGKATFFLAEPIQGEGGGGWPQDYATWQRITGLCKSLGIPTVYWETEKPFFSERQKLFIDCFDYIFVAHSEYLPFYQKLKRYRNLSFLPVGIQLRNYSPENTRYFGRKELMPSKGDVYSLREAMSLHSYTSRLETMLTVLGLAHAAPEKPGVTILTATNKPDTLDTVFDNYERQKYEPKEMVVLLNNNSLSLQEWQERADRSKHVRVFRIDESKPLGWCLNQGIDESGHPYISKFDDDNFYGENFLTDLMHGFRYAEAEIVGKLTYFCYLEASRILAVLFPGMENRYVNFLSGSGLVIQRKVFDQVRFDHQPQGSDSIFLKDCVKKGVRMYSGDRFNYVYTRRASKLYHTCKVSDETLLRSSQFIARVEDYRQYVSI